MYSFIYKTFKKKTTTAGFEPTLPEGNRLAGDRLNHSATLPYIQKTTVAGFEPTHPEDNWFQVNRLRPLGHTVFVYFYPTPVLYPSLTPAPAVLLFFFSLTFFFFSCPYLFLYLISLPSCFFPYPSLLFLSPLFPYLPWPSFISVISNSIVG